MATATAMSTEENVRVASGVQIAFIRGTTVCARAAALTSRSVTETFVPIAARSARSSSSSSTRIVARSVKCGTVCLLSVSRRAIARRIGVCGTSV